VAVVTDRIRPSPVHYTAASYSSTSQKQSVLIQIMNSLHTILHNNSPQRDNNSTTVYLIKIQQQENVSIDTMYN